MAAILDLSCPEASRAACLKQDDGRFVLGKEAKELGAGEAAGFSHLAWMTGDRYLEHVFAKSTEIVVDFMVHSSFPLTWVTLAQRCRLSHQEESILSGDLHGVRYESD